MLKATLVGKMVKIKDAEGNEAYKLYNDNMSTSDGRVTKMCKAKIYTAVRGRKKEGDQYGPSAFINCTAWGALADRLNSYDNADQVSMMGDLSASAYIDKNGNPQVNYDFTVTDIDFKPGSFAVSEDDTEEATPATKSTSKLGGAKTTSLKSGGRPSLKLNKK